MTGQNSGVVFENLWEYQQGALFLKQDMIYSLRKELAEYFYGEGFKKACDIKSKELEKLDITCGIYSAQVMELEKEIDVLLAQQDKLGVENEKLKQRLLDFEGRTFSENEEIAKLNRVVRVMEDALEFYSDQDNWYWDNMCGTTDSYNHIEDIDIENFTHAEKDFDGDDIEILDGKIAGKHAREALAKVREILGCEDVLNENENLKQRLLDFEGMTFSENEEIAKLKQAVAVMEDALNDLHKKVGSCPYSNADRWGDTMEYFYRNTGLALSKCKELLND
jgi:regulator of replication initiation timing